MGSVFYEFATGTLVVKGLDTPSGDHWSFVGLPGGTALTVDASQWSTNNVAGLYVNVKQDTTASGTRWKPGIAVDSYHSPDNGGEASGIFVVESGAGNGISVFKVPTLRPAGSALQSSEDGVALEVGTAAGYAAISVGVGFDDPPGTPTTQPTNVMWANLFNSVAKGILIGPGSGGFDTRVAFETAIGNKTGANTDPRYQVLLNGSLGVGGPANGTPGDITSTGSTRIEKGLTVGAVTMLATGTINAEGALYVQGTQVVGTRKTGWGAATGTATRTTFATTTVTTELLAQRVKALIDDLMAHGLINV
jgi:hypothetical protein